MCPPISQLSSPLYSCAQLMKIFLIQKKKLFLAIIKVCEMTWMWWGDPSPLLPLPGVSRSVWSLGVTKEVPDSPPCLLSVLLHLGSHKSLQDQSIQKKATKMAKGLEGKTDEEQLKSLLCSSQSRGGRGKASWRPTASLPQEDSLPFLCGILDMNILAHTMLLL